MLTSIIDKARTFSFCGPSDDPDEQMTVTLGYRHLIIQFKRLAAPILPEAISSRLNALDVKVSDLYSVFEAQAELDAMLPDIEDALESLDNAGKQIAATTSAQPLPAPICSVVGNVIGAFIYHHKTLETLFYEVGATGDVPDGNCVTKCQTWLKRMHTDVSDPVAVCGKVIEHFMEVDDRGYHQQSQQDGRKKITDVLARFDLSYHQGGLILGAANALSTKSLKQVLQGRDLASVDKEFDRAVANVEKDPPAAITAACAILEALFKVYIEDNGIEKPPDQSLKPLWKLTSKHLGLDPTAIEDNDAKKVLSGLTSVVDGISSLRTHTGTAHGRGRGVYRPYARHARLAVHASHTLVRFFIETWDERKQRHRRS